MDGEAEVLLDPNTLSEDGTVALNGCAVSEDAQYLCYGITSSGSDWVTIKVMHIHTKNVEPDTLSWVNFLHIVFILSKNVCFMHCLFAAG